MKKRGAPRSDSPCPFDKSDLPEYCYWDKSGRGHWYTTYYNEAGKRRRRRIAGPNTTLKQLKEIMDTGHAIDSLNWLHQVFLTSPQFKKVGRSQQNSLKYGYGMVSKHETLREGVTLGQIPLQAWKPSLVQKLMDSLGEKHGPSAAKKAKEYLSRVFNWGVNREYLPLNPVGKPEMPKERSQQRNPDNDLLVSLVEFARARGSQAKRKGSCAPYIWIALEVCRKCRWRGVEAFTMVDEQVLDHGIESRRRKGSRDNITEWDPGLERAINAALAHRDRVRKATPIDPQQRYVIVGTSGQRILPHTWQSAWQRFIALAISEEIITKGQLFGLHDMKRRGTTDTPGTIADKLDATGLSDAKILRVYDKSLPVVKPAPDK